MRVKVFIHDGIDALCKYEQALYEDASLKSINFSTPHFEEESDE